MTPVPTVKLPVLALTQRLAIQREILRLDRVARGLVSDRRIAVRPSQRDDRTIEVSQNLICLLLVEEPGLERMRTAGVQEIRDVPS